MKLVSVTQNPKLYSRQIFVSICPSKCTIVLAWSVGSSGCVSDRAKKENKGNRC